MANTFKFGNGEWAVGKETVLAYNDENNNFKPLPFSFDRASTATVVNKDGLIETVGVDEPRIDFLNNTKGHLLLEPQRKNEFTYSEDFNQWDTTQNATLTSDSTISPDGSVNATKITDNSTNGNHRVFTSLTTTSGSNTFSVYLKKGTMTTAFLRFLSGSDIANANVNLEEGTITATTGTAEIQNAGNDWYRCSITGIATSGTSYVYIYMKQLSAYSGTSQDLFLWGAQLEAGSYATSYIPTSGQSGGVTRSAETCYQDNLLTDIINASYPFTMYAEAKAVIDDTQHFLTFSNRSLSNAYFTLVLNSDGTVKLDARANGISEDINSSATGITNGDFFKTAVTMESATSGKICVNGVLDSKTNFTQQAINTNIKDLLVGMLRTVTDTGRRMPVKDVKLYNTALTDAELIALTTI